METSSAICARRQRGVRIAIQAFEVEVYRWILSIVRDPGTAEDAVVGTFWRVYRGRARFDSSRSFGAWIRRIGTNAARDQLRAVRSRGWYQTDIELAVPAARPDDAGQSPALIKRAFAGLPPRPSIGYCATGSVSRWLSNQRTKELRST